MATKRTKSEAETLELYRISLENVGKQPTIAASMAGIGYDVATISEGKALLKKTRQTFDINRFEARKTAAAYADFLAAKATLGKTYGYHRKISKIIFKKDTLTLNRLALSGSMPKAYIAWLETVKTFYRVSTTDPSIQDKLARLKITADALHSAQTIINKLETTRTFYLRKKGESQNATKTKNKTFEKLDKWMAEFYAVAKIALEDKPQLMESLGKLVKG